MESQGSHAQSVGVVRAFQAASRTGRTLVRWLLWGVLLCGSMAHATTNVRDANGRVVAVTQSNGTSTQYTYDALGNRLQVGGPIAAGQLAVFTFIPSHGTAGTAVTIYGQGFSSTLANDSVSFNGTVATLLSATATQLVASVPVGASTGPIGVTVGGLTVNSATPFVIDDTGEPPTISGVSPSVVVEGGTVTVTGTHLDPLPGQTTMQMGGREVALSSASDTQLIFTALDTSSSGYVVVQTPYGQATSPASVVVLPSGFSAAGLVSSGYATANGAAVNLNIGAAGQIGAVLFNATSGQWLSLQASAITTTATNISYTVYAPGNVVIAQGTVSVSSPSIHLPQLTADGTYMATFQPNTAGAQLTVAVLTDAMLTSGVPVAQAATVPSQSERLLFSASAGANLELTLSSVNVTGGTQNGFTVNVYDLQGSSLVSFTCYASNPGASCREPLWNLVAGTYSVVVTPTWGGTINFTALLEPDVIGPALAANTPTTVTLGEGQVERLTFTATAGQTIALNLTGVSTTPAGQVIGVNIYSPSLGAIGPTNYTTQLRSTSSTTLNLPNLAASGTYTVVVWSNDGVPGSAQLTLVPQ